jgi:hypothetical protein
MSLRAYALIVFFVVTAPAGASTGINWFGGRDVNSDAPFSPGDTFRGMADVNGDGNADYCRFLATQLVCAVSDGQVFKDDAVKSQAMYDAGDDTFRGLADVDGDGKADYCRFVGSGAGRRLSCGKSNGTAFGSNDVDSPAGYDAGFDTFRALADIDGDGKADYCRFVGTAPNVRLSCGRSNGTTFGSNDVDSQPGLRPGIDGELRAMADVNADGKADYCRILASTAGNYLGCALATGTGFIDITLPGGALDFGNGTFRALADVNGDGRADFCRTVGTGDGLACALTTAAGFGPDAVMNAEPYELGFGLFGPFHAMADVNGDRRADYVRFLGSQFRPRLVAGLAAKALVVDTIPASFGAETHQDSEPFLAVAPTNVANMVVSAFIDNPARPKGNAPILVSRDNGMTWSLRATVPSRESTGDISLAFADTAGTTTGPLYGGILRRPGGPQYYDNLLTADFASETAMMVQASRTRVDQPFVQAGRTSNDRLFIGVNDFAKKPGTATVDVSSTGGASFTSRSVEKRTTQGQDAPPIRPAYCRGTGPGIVYVGFIRWSRYLGNDLHQSDVVVVRDDQGGVGENSFKSLLGPDGKAGTFVAQDVIVPFLNRQALGFERIAGQLSVAVDPSSCSNVYVAWGDRTGTDIYTLHVRRSTDSGASWSGDLQTLHNATTPALAVTPQGVVGLLYQQLTSDNHWITRIVQTKNAFGATSETILATTSSEQPAGQALPYLGDYNYLLALDDEFRGVFSANNTPAAANFPSGALFQRAVKIKPDNPTLRKPDGTAVAISIDPFYFSIRAIR